MQLIESFITNNENFKAKKKLTVKGLMLHSVGTPQPNPEVFVKIFNDPSGRPGGRQVGVHAFLGTDGRVFQTMPWDIQAWHGGGSVNSTHIGVEMTEPKTIKYTVGSTFEDKDPAATKAFVNATYATAVELFAFLCKEFSLDPLKDGVIISHSEGCKRGIASNHGDVEHIWKRFGLTMDKFRQAVKDSLSGGGEPSPSIVRFNLLGKTHEIPGLIVDGSTFFAQARPLLEALGYAVEWDSAASAFVVKKQQEKSKTASKIK